ncbi:VanZ family protein [Lysinibacillus piscis]|uniref:VanZ-like domain-containing protein n=1 Tax=Lysinibacillus piscis TaxID=2518931 RepID=A0ABQ5NNK1_9BACI|nr:VanZ family protein [Lysinibacillus sp. KH24]GLC89923.1 hypothetical protein LYSBPC_30500 [Lysinibacillus sp. KH24]
MKKRNLIIVITSMYTALTLYFMFLGFNRLTHRDDYIDAGYEFMLVPSSPPLQFPSLTFSWLYDFGNIAAFIPFGILLPLLKNYTYKKFISLFVIVILLLETLQSLVHLGTFDVDDVISNTIGATIGYILYKIGFTSNVTLKKLLTASFTAILLFVCVMGISEVFEKRVSAIQPLQELTGDQPLTDALPTFTVAGKKKVPQFNVYNNEGTTSTSYTYTIEGKEDFILYLNMGIPDDVEFQGNVIIVADGEVKFKSDEVTLQESKMPLEIPLYYEYEKMTITITGNVMLWDVGFTALQHWWE